MASTHRSEKPRTRPGGRNAQVREAVQAAVRAELQEKGYDGLSHRAVAARAGVDATTVYRRWATRSHLIGDALLNFADSQIQLPDTGRLVDDLTAYLRQIISLLSDSRNLRLAQALTMAATEREEAAATLREFWNHRFARAFVMLERAVSRGELAPGSDFQRIVEDLVAPTWFRVMCTQMPLDDMFVRRCVETATSSRGN